MRSIEHKYIVDFSTKWVFWNFFQTLDTSPQSTAIKYNNCIDASIVLLIFPLLITETSIYWYYPLLGYFENGVVDDSGKICLPA